MKCDITFLLVQSVMGYPCFASYRYPQKHGRKKNYVAQKFCINDWSFQFHSASQRHIFFLSRFIQSQCSMTRMLIVVPRPSLMLIPPNWPTKRILMQVRKLSKIFETAVLLSRHATLPSGTVTGDRGKIDHWLTGAFPETILVVRWLSAKFWRDL